MNFSAPGFPVPHYLLESAHVHAHWISNATQPSDPLLPPSLLPSVFPIIIFFSNETALASGGQSIRVCFPALALQRYAFRSLLVWQVWYPCFPRVSRESSPVQLLGLLKNKYHRSQTFSKGKLIFHSPGSWKAQDQMLASFILRTPILFVQAASTLLYACSEDEGELNVLCLFL